MEDSTTTCTVAGCLDAEKPIKEILQWPEANHTGLLTRKLDRLNSPDGKLSSTTPNTSSLKYCDEKYYASRNIFLRSYHFTKKKETLCTRTKKWLKNKPKTLFRRQTDGGSSRDNDGGSPSIAKGRSFGFLLCMTKLT